MARAALLILGMDAVSWPCPDDDFYGRSSLWEGRFTAVDLHCRSIDHIFGWHLKALLRQHWSQLCGFIIRECILHSIIHPSEPFCNLVRGPSFASRAEISCGWSLWASKKWMPGSTRTFLSCTALWKNNVVARCRWTRTGRPSHAAHNHRGER